MTSKTHTSTRAQGLRRKARQLARKANLSQAKGKVWDAATLRQQAKNLELRATCHEEAVYADLPFASKSRVAAARTEDIPSFNTVREAEDFYGLVLR